MFHIISLYSQAEISSINSNFPKGIILPITPFHLIGPYINIDFNYIRFVGFILEVLFYRNFILIIS